MRKPHKHAEYIKAWADGAEIEWLSHLCGWVTCDENPLWLDDVEYRVKSQEC